LIQITDFLEILKGRTEKGSVEKEDTEEKGKRRALLARTR
jgi:hypothetical protein